MLVIRISWVAIAALPLLLGGCVLAPRGTNEEKARLHKAGEAYQPPVEQRALPELSETPDWRDVLRRAFLANGDLEAAYFEWQAAVARIDRRSAYPNTNLSLGYSYMFSPGNIKSWDRSSVSAQPDPMANLALPNKVAQAGRVALDEARAAGQRFRAAKFDLQKKVLGGYLDLALMEEKIRIARQNVGLLQLLAETAGNRVQAGGPQQDLLKAQIELRLAENDLAGMEADQRGMRAMLNGMLARDPSAPLGLPAQLPEPRALGTDDAALIAAAADNNPGLAALAHDVAGRQDALQLARLQYLPDINPTAAFTGSMSQSIGAMVSIPIAIPMIRAMVEEERSMLRGTEAMARQKRRETAAEFVAALVALRNHERQVVLLRDRVLPAAEQVLASSRQAYATGSVGFADLIDSQRTLLQVRLMTAEARVAREKRLVEIEAIAAVDVETLATPKLANP